MKKILLIAATLLAALSATVGLAPSASAYPELTCNLTVEPQAVSAGDTLTATGSAVEVEKQLRASAAGDGISWVMTFNGETRSGSGAVFVQKFTVPEVSSTTTLVLSAKSTSAAGTCQHTVSVTVVPGDAVVAAPAAGGAGALPNTGGPRLILLVAGLALIAAGGVAVKRSRRDA